MDHAQLGRLNSLARGVIGSVLLGLALGGSAHADGGDRETLPRDAVFTVQSLPGRSARLAPVTADPALRPGRLANPSPLPDLDANANAVAIQHIKLENEGWERDYDVPEPAEPSFNEP